MAGTQLFNFGTTGTGGNGMFNIQAGNAGGQSSVNPGVVPSSGSTYSAPKDYGDKSTSQWFNPSSWGTHVNPADAMLDPQLTKNFSSWLQNQIGKGATPFGLSSTMPSTGQATAPGQLTAPNNPLIQMLMQSFLGGPMAGMTSTGNPIDQTPAWQAMVESMQRGIKSQEANLREQFNVGGGLVGSPYGSAVTDFESQTAKDLNSQLLTAQTGSLENAQNRILSANQFQSQFGQYLQGLDQGAIDKMYQEFIRTQPEYSPLLSIMSEFARTPSSGVAGQTNGIDQIMQLLPLLTMGM